jgi:predicted esterase
VIHGRNDEIMPFANAERTADALAKMGKDIHFEGLNGLTHFAMGGYIPALSRAGRWVAERWARAGKP